MGTLAKGVNLSGNGQTALAGVEGIATNPTGTKIYAVVGNDVNSYDVNWSTGALTNSTTIASTLDDPHGLHLFDNPLGGYSLAVTQWGTSHNVLFFTLNDTPPLTAYKTIGGTGEAQVGVYDEDLMYNPVNSVVDSGGDLWVTEYHYMPKRFARWDTTAGTVVKAFYGPNKYGAEVFLDPDDDTKAYYATGTGTIEFELDWATGEMKGIKRLLQNKNNAWTVLPTTRDGYISPSRFWTYNGKTYGESLQKALTGGAEYTHRHLYLVRADTVAWISSAFGRLTHWKNVYCNNDGNHAAVAAEALAATGDCDDKFWGVIWSDENDDGDVNTGESVYIEWGTLEQSRRTPSWANDLSIYFSDGTHIAPTSIDAAGIPTYASGDVKDAFTTSGEEIGWGNNAVDIQEDDTMMFFIGGPIEFYKNGSRIAYTHDQFPKRAPNGPIPPYDGYITRSTRIASNGFIPVPGLATEKIVGLALENGPVALFTRDGFYIGQVFEDARISTFEADAYPNRGEILRGDYMETPFSPGDEHYGPTINQSHEDSIYVVWGKGHSTVSRIDNLETIERYDLGDLVITEQDVLGLAATVTVLAIEPNPEGIDIYMISGAGDDVAPTIDGDLSEWAGRAYVSAVSTYFGMYCATMVDDTNVYFACSTGRDDLLTHNTDGVDWEELPPWGGFLELRFGAIGNTTSRGWGGSKGKVSENVEGDQRVIITRAGGDPVAGDLVVEVIEPRTSRVGLSRSFSTDCCLTDIDYLANESSNVTLAQTAGYYELSFPLSILGSGYLPEDEDSLRWDMSIATGTTSGTTNRNCVCDNTSEGCTIVQDVPTEMRVYHDDTCLSRFTTIESGGSGFAQPSLPESAPTLLDPGDGDTGTALPVTLTWEQVDAGGSSVSYSWQVALSATFSPVAFSGGGLQEL
jgi:hypothetical protein